MRATMFHNLRTEFSHTIAKPKAEIASISKASWLIIFVKMSFNYVMNLAFVNITNTCTFVNARLTMQLSMTTPIIAAQLIFFGRMLSSPMSQSMQFTRTAISRSTISAPHAHLHLKVQVWLLATFTSITSMLHCARIQAQQALRKRLRLVLLILNSQNQFVTSFFINCY